jgi:integrase
MKSRGDGRIFQRKDTAFWWCAYYLRGKEYRETTGETVEQKALKFLKRRLKEVGADQIGAKPFVGPRQERVTVSELLDALERDYRLREKWNRKVASNVKPLREYFGPSRAVDVTSDSVSTYMETLREEGYSNATVNRRTQLLEQAYKVAVRSKRLSAAPFIPRLSEVGNERQGFFETKNFETVVTCLPEYLRDFTRFGFLTGWRKGSIQSLRWQDVAEGVIYLRAENSKTRKPETVPLEGELLEIIERRRAAAVLPAPNGQARFCAYVFHRNGSPIGDLRKAWATACISAGVGKMVCPQCGGEVSQEQEEKDGNSKIFFLCVDCSVRWKHEQLRYTGRIFHDLRRTAARNMVSAGVPPQVAMRITGHRTDAMFRRYAIVDEDQKRQALAKTQDYLQRSGESRVVLLGRARANR